MNIKELTIALSSMMTVSGHECESTEKLFGLIGEHFDEYRRDAVGNHILIKRAARENAPTAFIDAHFDEIGMIVSDINDGGFLSATSIGGIDPAILQASEVRIYGKEEIHGIITSTPPHLSSAGDKEKLKAVDELYIDTGYSKEELCELVRIGDAIGFAPNYYELGKESGCIAGKSFDDKACAAAAIYGIAKTEREKLAANVVLSLSCHEETINRGGVAPAAFGTMPDYAMVIDVNFARDPNTKKNESIEMGEGVSVSLSAVTDKKLTYMTLDLCCEKGIKHQKVVAASSTGTNATALNLVCGGVPVVDVGLPLKNMHTPAEVINICDSETLATLVSEFISSEKIAEVFGNER